MDNFKQRATAELARYKGLPLGDREKVRLLNVVVAPTSMHKAPLLGMRKTGIVWTMCSRTLFGSPMGRSGDICT